ncbi:MAG TPA: hypothetical protein VFE32_07495 [Puia sp.]|jgi:hypothetical protein|nr:hypothetical protein [Puia sp.]
MAKDRRYITVKNLITAGYIKSFSEIFDTIPKTVVARDLGMNNDRFTKLMNDVTLFRIGELYRLARFLEIDGMVLINLVVEQLNEKKDKKKVQQG